MKKNNKNNKILKFFLEKIKSEHSKPLFGFLFFFVSLILLISFLSKQSLLSAKVGSFLLEKLGSSSIFLIFYFLFLSYFFIKKENWTKLLYYFLGLTILFLIINFYSHLLFREGGKLGYFILGFSKFVGSFGLVLFSLGFIFLSFWFIFEDKLFIFLKNLFFKIEKEIKEVSLQRTLIKKPTDIKTSTIKIGKKEIISKEKKELKIKPKVLSKGPWKLPSLDFLLQTKEEVVAVDIKNTSNIIKKSLESFGISSEIVEVEIGPAVTRFSLKPGEGIKISKILSLQKDIALALGVPNLYIETPVPGKAVIGIEVPNIKSAIVRLGNLLKEKEFLESKEPLFFPIGRKINGEVLFENLARMPHLLIAGTTGSGKSIFIHSLLISFLMRNTPETLNLVLVDPKRVELSLYSGLPHLVLEPITNVKKSLSIFNWLIEEMEERYKILEENQARDIDVYNKKQTQKKEKLIPRIILIIDELADLMVTYGSSLENLILRLSQMARATGIHLVLATQRPSVDIVTGLIKANIPNRICFKVASHVDSRTVLDIGGAEKLIGQGDSLFISSLHHRPIRIKAPLVTEQEIEKVVNFWKEQIEKVPSFEKEKIDLEELEKKVISFEETEDEELLNEAIKIVLETGKASTSLLQRRLKIGYARAARLLDFMEEKGIVGPQEGSKPRKVLIDKDNFNYLEEN